MMDRLTTLMTHFQLSVVSAEPAGANFLALADAGGDPAERIYSAKNTVPAPDVRRVIWAGQVDWSGDINPFLAAFPAVARLKISQNAEAQGIVRLIQAETRGARCGAGSVVNRLAEVLIVRLLRHQIEFGTAQRGVLAGLSDDRIARAVVAIHDQPGQNWTNGTLAAEAGLSLSRFTELFSAIMEETPMGYLRRWRLILASQDLKRGARVQAVARRYAYTSSEAFSRAFRKAYGVSPVSLRKVAQG